MRMTLGGAARCAADGSRAWCRGGAVSIAVLLVGLGALRPAHAAVPREVIGGERLGSTGIVVEALPGATPLPAVRAESYVVADADSGEVLAAKGAHVPRPPASTLKTLTALTGLRTLKMTDRYVAQYADEAVEGTRVGLTEGSAYSLRDLYYGMFLKSGNDAALGVSHLGGGERLFVARMNDTAQKLGARDTLARTPTGLDEPGQVSSAYDLALFGRAVLRDDRLRDIAATTTYPFPGPEQVGKRRGVEEIRTLQRFVWNYDGALGVKNGFTTQAGQTLVAASRRGNRTILVTLLRSGVGSWREAVALSDWAYANADRVRPVGTLVEPSAETAARVSATAATGGPPVTPPSPARTPGSALFWAVVAAGAGAVVAAALASRRRTAAARPSALPRSRRRPPTGSAPR